MRKQLPHLGRRRIQPILLVAGVAASAALAISMTGTLSAFVASITNSNNTAESGTVILQETAVSASNTTVTCTSTDTGPSGAGLDNNAATCASINKYGGKTAMVPNTTGSNTVTTTETFKNTGTAAAASFTLTPGTCTQSPANGVSTASNNTAGSATNFCTKLNVVIGVTAGTPSATSTTTYTAASLAALTAPISLSVPAAQGGSAVTVTFTVSIDSSAGNTYQGLTASQPLTWTLTS